MVCLACGRVEEFHDSVIEQLQEQIAASRGHALQAHSLALYGLCGKPGCPGSHDKADAPKGKGLRPAASAANARATPVSGR